MNNLIEEDTSSFASFIKATYYLLEGIWMVQKHGQEFETFQSLATTSVLFFQIMAFENLRKIFSWKYSLDSSLKTLMSFINIFRLSFEKVKFYWLGDITRIGLTGVSGDEWKRESTRTDLVPKILWSHPYLMFCSANLIFSIMKEKRPQRFWSFPKGNSKILMKLSWNFSAIWINYKHKTLNKYWTYVTLNM